MPRIGGKIDLRFRFYQPIGFDFVADGFDERVVIEEKLAKGFCNQVPLPQAIIARGGSRLSRELRELSELWELRKLRELRELREMRELSELWELRELWELSKLIGY
jgi:hypothetical protein